MTRPPAMRPAHDAVSRGSREPRFECSAEAKGADGDRLTDELACRFMGWRLAPGRFITSGRHWMTRRHFQPLQNLDHAFQLLGAVNATYSLTFTEAGVLTATVRVGDLIGQASGEPNAMTVTLATARALGLYPPQDVPSSGTTETMRRSGSRRP
jgi:hypothetical protein